MPKSRGRKKGRGGPTPRKANNRIRPDQIEVPMATFDPTLTPVSMAGTTPNQGCTITPSVSDELLEASYIHHKGEGYLYDSELVEQAVTDSDEFELIHPDCNEQKCLKARQLRLSHDDIAPMGMPKVKNFINDILTNGAWADSATDKKYIGLRPLDKEWELQSYKAYFLWCKDKLPSYLKKGLYATKEHLNAARAMVKKIGIDKIPYVGLTHDAAIDLWVDRYLNKISREVDYITKSQASFQILTCMTKRVSEDYSTIRELVQEAHEHEWDEGSDPITKEIIENFGIDKDHFGTEMDGHALPIFPIVTKEDLSENFMDSIFQRRNSYYIHHQDKMMPSCLVTYSPKGSWDYNRLMSKYTGINCYGRAFAKDYADYSTLWVKNKGDMEKTPELTKEKMHWEAIQIHSTLTNAALPMANKDMQLWYSETEHEEAKVKSEMSEAKVKRYERWSNNGGMSKLSSVAKKHRSKIKNQDEFMFFHFSHRSNFQMMDFSRLGHGKTGGREIASPTENWNPFVENFAIGVSKDLHFYFEDRLYYLLDFFDAKTATIFLDSMIGMVMNTIKWLDYINKERIEYVEAKRKDSDKDRQLMGRNAPEFDEDAVTEEYEQKWITVPQTFRRTRPDERKARKAHQGGTHASPYPHIGILIGDRYKNNPTYGFYKRSDFSGIEGVRISKKGEMCAYRINWPKGHPLSGSKSLDDVRKEQKKYIHDRGNAKAPKTEKRNKRQHQVLVVPEELMAEVREAVNLADDLLKAKKDETKTVQN